MKCSQCSSNLPPHKSKCTDCGQWNIVANKHDDSIGVSLADVGEDETERILTGPWDWCWGGGITSDTITLLGGEPGAGKSTLALQIAARVGDGLDMSDCVLYIGTEESESQVKGRAKRLAIPQAILRTIVYVNAMGGIDLETLLQERQPRFTILDSLPGFSGEGVSDGDDSINTCRILKEYAEETHAPAIITDHVTKADDFAGWKKLQHAVDTLITFNLEGPDGGSTLRVMRTKKNRHGPAPRVLQLDMTETGLVLPGLHCKCPGVQRWGSNGLHEPSCEVGGKA